MELEKWMLDQWTDEKIALETNINPETIRVWRNYMARKLTRALRRERPPTFVSPKHHDKMPPPPETEMQQAFVITLTEEYQEYVHIPNGIIDVLTPTTIYELKPVLRHANFQKAVGQILLYAQEMYRPSLVIVAESMGIPDSMIRHAQKLGISVIGFKTSHN